LAQVARFLRASQRDGGGPCWSRWAEFWRAAWSGGGLARQALPSAMSVPESVSSAAMFLTAASDLVSVRMLTLCSKRSPDPLFGPPRR
jgi:hypothetical protein